MSHAARWGDNVSDPLFKEFCIGKAAVAFAIPDELVVHMDCENATDLAGNQSDTAEIV